MTRRAAYSAACLAVLIATFVVPARAAEEKCDGKVATIVGTKGRDKIQGTNEGDVIVSLGGDDNVDGRGGDDTICSGGGDDRVFGEFGNDVVGGGDGRDYIHGGGGNDTIDGGPGSDSGSNSLDFPIVLNGGPGDDLLFGDSGRDELLGDLGADTLEGGLGNDVLDGENRSHIDDDGEFDWVTYENEGSGVTLNLSHDVHGETARVGSSEDRLFSIDNARLSDHADVVVAFLGESRVILGKGDDRITRLRPALSREGVFKGGPGIDTFDFRDETQAMRLDLAAQTFADVVDPSESDRVEGFENAIGGAHFDVLVGDAKANRLEGGDGEDLIEAGDGNDTVLGDAGNDSLFGEGDDDKLYGKDGPHNGLDEETDTNLTDGGPGIDDCFETGSKENCENVDEPDCEVLRAAQASDGCSKIVWAREPWVNGNPAGDWELMMANPDGSGVQALTQNRADDTDPELSPEGGSIVFVREPDGGSASLYIMRSDGSGATQIPNTTNSGAITNPTWSPDGTRIMFSRWTSTGSVQPYVINTDGTGLTHIDVGFDPVVANWSSDGSKIVYVALASDGNFGFNNEIFVANVDGSGRTQITKGGGGGDGDVQWSPDGSLFLFSSFASGSKSDVFTVPISGGLNSEGETVATPVTSTSDALSFTSPSWSPSGDRIVMLKLGDDYDLYTIGANGSGLTRVTTVGYRNGAPDWGYFSPPS